MRRFIGLCFALFCSEATAQAPRMPKLCSFDYDVTSSEIGYPEQVSDRGSGSKEWVYIDGTTFTFKDRYLVTITAKSGDILARTEDCTLSDKSDAALALPPPAVKLPVKLAAKPVAKRPKIKKEGVRIGMTQAEVLASSWGRPDDINKTTTAYGTSEQWVYGHRNYLYFRNGILTTIQN
jgi:hypothetical protein